MGPQDKVLTGRVWSLAFLAAALLAVSCGKDSKTLDADFAAKREAMARLVAHYDPARGVKDERVLSAMRKVPRHLFVPPEMVPRAYDDGPFPIGYGQTISQPFIVGLMTEALRLEPTDRVLEVGTGSGYQAAILAELAGEVDTIEIVEPLGLRAEETLKALGYGNVHVRIGDGYLGWPEKAPFDAVIVTCAPTRIPRPLLDQLKVGGRLVIPVGPEAGPWTVQKLYVVRKTQGGTKTEAILDVRFVPMQGEARRR